MDKKGKQLIIEGNHILCFNNLVDFKTRNPRFLILCTRLDFQKVRGQKRPEPSIPYSMYVLQDGYIYMRICDLRMHVQNLPAAEELRIGRP